MSDLRVYLFGTPRIEYQGRAVEIGRRKALALVAYLALAQQNQSRDAVATLLWPDSDQERARNALRSTLPTLTGITPEPWLEADRNTISLNRQHVWIDVTEFLDRLAKSRAHGHDTLCEECVGWLCEAVALYREDFLAGFAISDSPEFDEWQTFQQEWLRREFGGVLRRLARYYSEDQADAAGYEMAVEYGRRWLALDPLHEPAHRLLMRVLAASGRRSEALRQYQECVELLDRELATPPEEATVALYEAIRNDAGVPLTESGVERRAAGILPPLPTLIVGREDVLRDLKRRLGVNQKSVMRAVTVIQGWPGVGKSTTVAALAHDADVARTFPDGILWASLGEMPNLINEVSAWAEALHLADVSRSRTLEEISAQLTAVLRDKKMLLIVDDVWRPEHAVPFKVGGQGCALVLTSRLNDVAQALAPTPSDVYRLPVLPQPKALDLLAMLAPEAVTGYPDEARELVHNLEGLPLAIQVAGRLLHNEARLGWGVTELLADLRAGGNLLTAQAPGDMAASGATTPTIAALLRRSTDALDPLTRQRFALLGLFVPKPATFDLEAMAAAWDVDDPKLTARTLVNRGLLEPVSGGRFQMHALLVLHAKSLLDESA